MVAIPFCQHAKFVENSLTLSADFGITCGELALVSKAVELDLKDVRVKLLSIEDSLLIGCSALGLLVVPAESAFFSAIFAVTQIKFTAKIVGVHLFARQVAIQFLHGLTPLHDGSLGLGLATAEGEGGLKRGKEAFFFLLGCHIRLSCGSHGLRGSLHDLNRFDLLFLFFVLSEALLHLRLLRL